MKVYKVLKSIIYFLMCLDCIVAVSDAMAFEADTIPGWMAVEIMVLCVFTLILCALAIWIINDRKENEKEPAAGTVEAHR